MGPFRSLQREMAEEAVAVLLALQLIELGRHDLGKLFAQPLLHQHQHQHDGPAETGAPAGRASAN